MTHRTISIRHSHKLYQFSRWLINREHQRLMYAINNGALIAVFEVGDAITLAGAYDAKMVNLAEVEPAGMVV